MNIKKILAATAASALAVSAMAVSSFAETEQVAAWDDTNADKIELTISFSVDYDDQVAQYIETYPETAEDPSDMMFLTFGANSDGAVTFTYIQVKDQVSDDFKAESVTVNYTTTADKINAGTDGWFSQAQMGHISGVKGLTISYKNTETGDTGYVDISTDWGNDAAVPANNIDWEPGWQSWSGANLTAPLVTPSAEEPTTEEPESEETAAPEDNSTDDNTATEAPSAGDTNTSTEDKNTPDTGVEGVAVVAGVAIIAAGAIVIAKKRK